MDGEIILVSVIILFILFIFVMPVLIWKMLNRITDPVPLYLPVILSGLALLTLTGVRLSGIVNDNDIFTGTVVTFILLLLLADLAVIAPYPYFRKKIGLERPWQVFTLLAFVGGGLLFYTTAGEMRYGMPMPPFSAPLPLTGWILDGTASILGMQDAVYAFGSPVYPLLEAAGLYLEILVLAVLYYWILGLTAKPKDAKN